MSDAGPHLLGRLYRGLRQRELIRADPTALRALERRLLPTLEKAADSFRLPRQSALTEPPPRRVAVAMALAVLSQPHLAQMFTDPPRPAFLPSLEVLQTSLGLSSWELDDLREEVDRRAGMFLKQLTLTTWLRSRYAPEELLGMLFPGAELKRGELLFRNSHLVVIADIRAASRSVLHLPWLSETGWGPLGAFRGRYIDKNLRRDIARGVGLTDEEVEEYLESMVSLLPRDNLRELSEIEAWRYQGYGALTWIGRSYPKLAWLSHPVDGQAVRWRDWLVGDAEDLKIVGPDRVFDALLQPRLYGLMEGVYGDVLARRLAQDPPFSDRLEVFDLSPPIGAISAPLLAWVKARGSATEVARSLGLGLTEAEELLGKVHEAWGARAFHWGRPSNTDFPQSSLASWMTRLLCLDVVLRDLSGRPSIGPEHRDLVFLFSGHFLAESPRDRSLFLRSGEGESVGRVLSRWFWPTWLRILNEIEATQGATHAEFLLPEGVF